MLLFYNVVLEFVVTVKTCGAVSSLTGRFSFVPRSILFLSLNYTCCGYTAMTRCSLQFQALRVWLYIYCNICQRLPPQSHA